MGSTEKKKLSVDEIFTRFEERIATPFMNDETGFFSERFNAKNLTRAQMWLYYVGAPLCIVVATGICTIVVANLVFTIQSLVVGAQYVNSLRSCETTLAVWLIVYGSLNLGSLGIACTCVLPSKEEAKEKGKKPDELERDMRITWPSALNSLIQLAVFGWLCYGINLISSADSFYSFCNSSLYNVFRIMVQFMFYGIWAVLGALLVMAFLFGPIVWSIIEPDDFQGVAIIPETQKPKVEQQQAAPTSSSMEETKINVV